VRSTSLALCDYVTTTNKSLSWCARRKSLIHSARPGIHKSVNQVRRPHNVVDYYPHNPPNKTEEEAQSLSQKKLEKKPRKSDPLPESMLVGHVDLTNANRVASEKTFHTALNFYDEDQRTFLKISSSNRAQLLSEMREWHPEILAITFYPPFLFVECETLPDPTISPFIVAGLVARFLDKDEPFPIGASFIGDPGRREADDLPDEVENDLVRFHIPSKNSFRHLFQRIPSAHHITSYPHQLLVELTRCPDDVYVAMLKEMLVQVGELTVGYMNGTAWFDKQARVKSPDPRFLDGTYDYSNYLAAENGGTLHPGSVV
jgi:hypothetical protein